MMSELWVCSRWSIDRKRWLFVLIVWFRNNSKIFWWNWDLCFFSRKDWTADVNDANARSKILILLRYHLYKLWRMFKIVAEKYSFDAVRMQLNFYNSLLILKRFLVFDVLLLLICMYRSNAFFIDRKKSLRQARIYACNL